MTGAVNVDGTPPPSTDLDVKALDPHDPTPRRNIHVPCKYGHGEGHGEPVHIYTHSYYINLFFFNVFLKTPTVFAYGGSLRNGKDLMPALDTFRTHFTWTSASCNIIFRAQFLYVYLYIFF
jgi:hypothetical protein